MDESAELLAADYPGWRIEFTAGGTGYYSAHLDHEDDSCHLGSPTAAGLRRMLENMTGGTVGDLAGRITQAGF